MEQCLLIPTSPARAQRPNSCWTSDWSRIIEVNSTPNHDLRGSKRLPGGGNWAKVRLATSSQGRRVESSFQTEISGWKGLGVTLELSNSSHLKSREPTSKQKSHDGQCHSQV